MDIRDFFADVGRSVAFLSRLPMPSRLFDGHTTTMSVTVRGFPLAGLLVTLPSAAMLCLVLSLGGDPLVAAVLALIVQALVTGALHEDGLSDSFDGLFGGRDRDRALAIMKDSQIGSYGAVALVLGLSLRAASIAALGRTLSPIEAAICLLALAVASRALMVWHWQALPPARSTGVAVAAGMPAKSAVQLALATAVVAYGMLLLPFASLPAAGVALVAGGAACLAFTRYVRGRIGGHTGDTIGATQQICEAVMLAALATAL